MKKTNKIISLLVAVVMLLGLLPVGLISANAAGAITADPNWWDAKATTLYIYDAADLVALSENCQQNIEKEDNPVYGKTVILMADIDLNPGWNASEGPKDGLFEWKPLVKTCNFVFDGNGHSISGFYTQSGTTRNGFIGAGMGTTVKNLAILNSYFANSGSGGSGAIGSVFGAATYTSADDAKGNYNVIENVYSDAIIVGSYNDIGGLIGTTGKSMQYVNLTDCVFAGSVTSTGKYVGGLVGNGNKQTYNITNCVNMGTVSASDEVAGIIGRNGESKTTTITNCVNLGTISCVAAKGFDADIVGKIKVGGTLAMTNCYYINGAGNDTPRAAGNGSECVTDGQTNVNCVADAAAIAEAIAADTNFEGWEILPIVTETPVMVPGSIVDLLDNGVYVQTGANKVRFIAVVKLDDLTAYDKVGFEITANGKTRTVTTSTVYTSILAGDETVYADTFGGDYFYVVEITGMPATDVTFDSVKVIAIKGEATSTFGTASYTYDVA